MKTLNTQLSISFIFLMIIALGLQAQTPTFKFAVQLNNKNGTPYSIDNPDAFLSQRAIDRRAKYSIDITETDLPINPSYIQEVLNTAPGASLHVQVKWLNTIVIAINDSSHMANVRALPIVNSVKEVYNSHFSKNTHNKFDYKFKPIDISTPIHTGRAYDSVSYGGSWTQVHQLKCNKLHKQGYTGQGMLIAVLDAGFDNVDQYQAFARLRNNNQIKGTYNFIHPGASVYSNTHGHGTSVLSCMGGYIEGALIGTAPDADYYLIMTEDVASESLTEEYNWVAGAAFADSIGADVVNSSLGYVHFDNPAQDHVYSDLDGQSAIATRGANLAAERGMIVVNAAGNEGDNDWGHIGVPADASKVVTVGAVDENDVIASFSSRGFSWSDDVKPNVVARGEGTFLASAWIDMIQQSNGTSFASPVMAGAIASLWSKAPLLHPELIKQAVEQSANRYSTPDTVYGYGMPNMDLALAMLGIDDNNTETQKWFVYPNPAQDYLMLGFDNAFLKTNNSPTIDIRIFNTQGALVYNLTTKTNQTINIKHLPKGMYLLELQKAGTRYTKKFIKN